MGLGLSRVGGFGWANGFGLILPPLPKIVTLMRLVEYQKFDTLLSKASNVVRNKLLKKKKRKEKGYNAKGV